MGIVIRTLYNNQGWKARCIKPYSDTLCHICCSENVHVNITPPSPGDPECSGHCWEENLCVDYRWGCTPAGRRFGSRAYPGMKVLFVYRQPGGNYTIWGMTTVRNIDSNIEISYVDGKGYSFMYFDAFEQLVRHKWVRDLTDRQLVGEEWRQGRYRYIDSRHDTYLEQLVERKEVQGGAEDEPITVTPPSSRVVTIPIMPNVEQKLDAIARQEGRSKEEIVREAIAEWLRGRGH